jgi:TetR/AcrR family transcriptional repressor of nem operon
MARPRKFIDEDVIAAAREQFWSAGYAGTSLDDLTEATGLGRGSLYGAFGDKHELFLRALDDYCGAVIAGVQADLRDNGIGGYQRLVDHLRNVANTAGAEAQRGCLIAKSAAELGATDKEVLSRVRRTLQDYEGSLRAVVEQAQRDGDLEPAVAPDELALVVLTFVRGAEALRRSGFTSVKMRAVTEGFIALLPRAGLAT